MILDTLDNMDNHFQEVIDIENYSDTSDNDVPKASKSSIDIHMELRYTFCLEEADEGYAGDLATQKLVTKKLISILSQFLVGDKLICGIEHFKSGKVECSPHVHIRFVTRSKKDTITKALKRALGAWYYKPRCYAMITFVHVDDMLKWWRYPLKQQKNDTFRFTYTRGISNEDKLYIRDVAYECWMVAGEVAVAKHNREDSDTLQERLFEYLSKYIASVGLNWSPHTIKEQILKFYVEVEHKPINFRTCEGYYYNYMLKMEYYTYAEIADKFAQDN